MLDGQHRVEAAKRAGIAHVPAVVVAAGNVAQQALAFVRANLDRVALNQYALFHARLAAEQGEAQAVKRVCDAAGLEIPRYPIPRENLKPGQTLALGGVSQLVAVRGELFATALLRVIAKACTGTHGQIKASLLRAASRIVENNLTKVDELGTVLSRTSIEKFFAFCEARRRREGTREADSIEAELRSRMRALAGNRPEPAPRESAQTVKGIPITEQKQTLAPAVTPARKPPAAAVGPGAQARAAAAARPAPASPTRAAELAAQAVFIQNKGVGRVAAGVESVYTPEQAYAALERMGIKYSRSKLSITIHGKAIPHGQLLAVVNRLLVERQMVRVKPGERVPA